MKKKHFITEKPCEACGKTIVKRDDEQSYNFNRRKCCYEGDCSRILRERSRQKTMEVKYAPDPFSNEMAQAFIRR